MAQFTAVPKESHTKAIKSIVRYLAQDPNKELIIKPDGTFDLKCLVDADFVGLHCQEPDVNPKSVKSRYGYIVTFGWWSTSDLESTVDIGNLLERSSCRICQVD